MAEFATPEYLRAIDEEGRYPYEIYGAWAALGLFRVGFPRAYGGLGGDLTDLLLLSQDLAYWSLDLHTVYSETLYAGLRLLAAGSEAQKQQLLPALMAGRVRLSTSVAEHAEDGAGNGAGTTATPVEGGWLLDGHMLWTSAAGARDNVLQVLARSDAGRSQEDGMSLFLVPNDSPGLLFRKFDMLGRRASGCYEVFFDEVFVGPDGLVGELHEGRGVWQECLPRERLLAAAAAVGAAQKAVDLAVTHAREREQGRRAEGAQPPASQLLADMQTDIDAGRLLVERAAFVLEAGRDASREVAMAALFCSGTYARVAGHGMSMLGRHAQLMEGEMQRHFREATSCTADAAVAWEQRDTIARSMGLAVAAACNGPASTRHSPVASRGHRPAAASLARPGDEPQILSTPGKEMHA